jgi:phosphoglycerate kinase
MKSIKEVADFHNHKVFIRVDWNVPMDEKGEVTDDSRIEASMETIDYVLEHHGKPIIASHFGRHGESIAPVAQYARSKYPQLNKAEIMENLRKHAEESTNDTDFAKELADEADYYVNEAFSASHRKHASIVGLPKYMHHFAGINFMREVEHLSKAFNPPHPFLLILGGAKFETKLPLINKFLNIADDIFIGGAMKAHHEMAPASDKIFFSLDPAEALDASPQTIESLKLKILNSKFILWNGPLGQFESGHDWGTKELAKILAESEAEVIIGGGDTIAAIESLNLKDKFTWASTAGGAMLDYLATGNLPGIEALG